MGSVGCGGCLAIFVRFVSLSNEQQQHIQLALKRTIIYVVIFYQRGVNSTLRGDATIDAPNIYWLVMPN